MSEDQDKELATLEDDDERLGGKCVGGFWVCGVCFERHAVLVTNVEIESSSLLPKSPFCRFA